MHMSMCPIPNDYVANTDNRLVRPNFDPFFVFIRSFIVWTILAQNNNQYINPKLIINTFNFPHDH